MNLPKNWKEVTVDSFIDIKSIDEGGNSLFLHNIEFLSVLGDIPPEDLEDLPPDEITDIILSVAWSRKEPSTKHLKTVGRYNLYPISKITLGQYIDLEHYFTDNFIQHLKTICAIRYRLSEEDKWGNIEFEPYIYSIHQRAEEFSDLPITDVYGVLGEYLEFRKQINTTYSGLFSSEEFDTEGLTQEEIREIEQEESKSKKWGWESIIYSLCDGDMTKADSVLNLPLIFVLNFLSMRVELKL
jgi:hypothetical protein